jgi:hypothetical protein
MHMTDDEIAAELQRRGLAAALGFAEEEGWTEEVFAAIEGAELNVRRQAALRTLDMGRDRPPPGGNA